MSFYLLSFKGVFMHAICFFVFFHAQNLTLAQGPVEQLMHGLCMSMAI